jgi:hypothetical protein
MKNFLKTISKFILFFSFLILFPLIAFAQTSTSITSTSTAVCSQTGIAKLICQTQQILNSIVPVLIALGVVYFVWSVVQYVIGDSEEAKKKGKDRIIYGLIGFAVIIGLWGFVTIVTTTFGIGGVKAPTLDTVVSNTSCNLGPNPKFQNYLSVVTCVINSSIIPFIFALAVVMFVWGSVKFFIINADEEAKRAQGKQFMVWGVVALAVMLSVWGLVGILDSTFGIKNNSILPQVTPPK